MKRISYLLATIYIILSATSCEETFLEAPQDTSLRVDSIFSTQQRALSAISQAYAIALVSGITYSDWDRDRMSGLRGGTLAQLSGEVSAVKYNWEDGWIISHNGMTADDGSGLPRTDDGFRNNYVAIRQCYLVIENIDKVRDMNQQEKDEVKAEMKTLIAYRYQEMFKRYGGVPIVKSTLSIENDMKIGRSSLKEVLEHVIALCDEAIAVLPNTYPDKDKGRVTKGVAMAIKAEIYMFAARPLFNSVTPFLSLGANNDLICLGTVDQSLWNKAIEASEAVIEWSLDNNYRIINTGLPLDDYGTAVSTPNNPEVLLAYKNQFATNYYDPHTESGGANSMSFYMLSQYYKADGTEQTWPGVETGYSDYQLRIEEMEPRYKASAMGAGIDAWNNPNDEYWSSRVLTNASTWAGRGGTEGCGRRVKFWYRAGNRDWLEFPIYRLAEFYLNLAEAYNEVGNNAKALENLNVIRDRAGLPDVTETNPAQLKKIIQREKAIEFYDENHHLYDVKHWKLDNIGDGIIGGSKKTFAFTYVNGDYGYVPSDYISYSVQEMYIGFWSPSHYLTPFPTTEINKGYLIQNPGY